jgi:hypothetical protein
MNPKATLEVTVTRSGNEPLVECAAMALGVEVEATVASSQVFERAFTLPPIPFKPHLFEVRRVDGQAGVGRVDAIRVGTYLLDRSPLGWFNVPVKTNLVFEDVTTEEEDVVVTMMLSSEGQYIVELSGPATKSEALILCAKKALKLGAKR